MVRAALALPIKRSLRRRGRLLRVGERRDLTHALEKYERVHVSRLGSD